MVDENKAAMTIETQTLEGLKALCRDALRDLRYAYDNFPNVGGGFVARRTIERLETALALPAPAQAEPVASVQSRAVTLADLSEALGCFWNAALGAQQAGSLPISCIVEGVQAVAWRLQELDAAPPPPAGEG